MSHLEVTPSQPNKEKRNLTDKKKDNPLKTSSTKRYPGSHQKLATDRNTAGENIEGDSSLGIENVRARTKPFHVNEPRTRQASQVVSQTPSKSNMAMWSFRAQYEPGTAQSQAPLTHKNSDIEHLERRFQRSEHTEEFKNGTKNTSKPRFWTKILIRIFQIFQLFCRLRPRRDSQEGERAG